MFALAGVPAVPYADPWHLPLQDRLTRLAGGRQRVAYFYEKPDNSTFRYRIYNMAQVLNDGTGEIAAAAFFLVDLHRLEEIAELADVLVICRTRYDHEVSRLIGAFRLRHKRVLFDTDDFVFDADYVQLLVSTLDLDVRNPQVWNDWFAYTSRLGATLRQCDGAITTTPLLAARIREFSGVPVAIVPNYMNREQIEMSDRVFAAKRDARPGASGLIHLGYFSGSPSHNRDFAMVAPALEALLAQDNRLGVVVVGYIEAGQGLDRFGSRVRRLPFHDYVNLQHVVGSVEYNLVPLQSNTFTNCKSELKVFEASAVGTVTIASPTEGYARVIRDGDTGFLARGYEWGSVIQRALDDIAGYRAMAERARADVLPAFAWTGQRQAIVAALGLG